MILLLLQQAESQTPRGTLPSLNQLLATNTPPFAYGLGFLGDLLWLVVYVLAIRIAIRQQTYAIPAAAIVLNVTWEFVHSVIFPPPAAIDLMATLLWLAFDLVILIQLFRPGREGQTTPEGRRTFRWAVLAGVVVAVLGHATFYLNVTANSIFPDRGGVISAYLINLVMSILFIQLFFDRPDGRGISKGIAWCKMLGTGAVSLANTISIFHLPPIVYQVQIRRNDSSPWQDMGTIGSSTIHPGFLYFLFLSVFVADLIYVVLVSRRPVPQPA